ncbi:MAG: hypothetical protein Q3983_07120 [Capnocytophaga sp.]|nr:hypothetical protein [Capnocytophaga sp.]
MYKLSKIVSIIFGVLGVLLCIAVMATSESIVKDGANTSMNSMFAINYILLGISLLVVIFAVGVGIMASPQSLKKTLSFVGAFVLIGVISYPLSKLFFDQEKTYKVVEGSKEVFLHYDWVSAGIMASYLLLLVSLIVVIGAVVKNSLTK